MKIALKDFRAFQETPLIDIRPLTFLVGENSSGKTSLMGAIYYIWQLKGRFGPVSLNTPPFDMGSFDEIVHRVRGRTKPECFEIIVEDQVTVDPQHTSFFYRQQHINSRFTDNVRMHLTFHNNVGDAVITKIDLNFGRHNLIIQMKNRVHVIVRSVDGRTIFDSDHGRDNEPAEHRIISRDQMNVDEMVYYLRRLIIELDRGSDKVSEESEIGLAFTGAALEQLLATFPNAIFASAPVRTNPSRVYTPADQNRTPEGSHTPQRLFKIKESNEARWEKIKSGLEKFGKASGMFTAINVARYRSSGSSPFHINVTRGGKQSNIVDVGYGVSQALPILTDLIESPSRSAFLFQQPEVHLHPQAQAALGSFFVDHIQSNPRSIIVAETHSDYLIDRVRLAVKSGQMKPRDVSILYFQTEGSATAIYQLQVDQEGNITQTPTGYRSFFIREQMDMLGILE